jgi:hypothetical protein
MRWTRLLAVIAGFTGPLAASSVATAGAETPTQRADRLFEESKALLSAGRFTEACPKLAESESLDPATGTLLALALCHEAEGKTASAYAELVRVSEAATREGRPDRVKVADAHLARLGPVVSRVLVAVPPEVSRIAGLLIECDGRAVPPPEWNHAAPFDPGEHVVAASAPGRAPWRVTFVLPKQATKDLTVPMLAELEVRPSVEAPPAASPSGGSRRTAGFITLAGGGAALAAGIGFGIAALVEQSSVEQSCPSLKCAPGAPGLAKSQTAQGDAWGADIGLGVGVLALAAGTYLVLTAPRPAQGAFLVLPSVGQGHAGVSVVTAW